MKLKAISLFVLLLSAIASADNNPTTSTPGQAGNQAESLQASTSSMAADFTEKDINDIHTISLSDYRGKVVMLNFWGPWCQPCRTEVPALERLQDKHKGKLVIIGAAVFSSDAAVELFYKDFAMNYPVIYGSYDLMDKYGKVNAFPTTIIIDQMGAIAGRVIGSRTGDQFEEMLKPLLAK